MTEIESLKLELESTKLRLIEAQGMVLQYQHAECRGRLAALQQKMASEAAKAQAEPTALEQCRDSGQMDAAQQHQHEQAGEMKGAQ